MDTSVARPLPTAPRKRLRAAVRKEQLADDFGRLGIGPLPLGRENPSAAPDTDFHAAYSDRARDIAAQVYREDLALTGCTF